MRTEVLYYEKFYIQVWLLTDEVSDYIVLVILAHYHKHNVLLV